MESLVLRLSDSSGSGSVTVSRYIVVSYIVQIGSPVRNPVARYYICRLNG
jgi:hypothetical protein